MPISSSTYNTGAQFRVTAVGENAGASDIINVYELFMRTGSSVAGTIVLSDIESYMRALYQLVQLICHVNTIWKGIRVEELDGNNATGLIPFVGGDLAGLVTGNSEPWGVAALINFPTGVKRLQPRKYFGVLGDTHITPGGNITNAGQVILANIGAYLVSTQPLNQDWHYSFNSHAAGVIVQPTVASVSPVPAYQRRRKVGVGG